MKFSSNINTYLPLGGEGWTRRRYSKPAQNRNNFAVLPGLATGTHAASSGTVRERSGCADTLATHRTGFVFTMRPPPSPFLLGEDSR